MYSETVTRGLSHPTGRSVDLPLNESQVAKASAAEGDDLILGVRPEDIYVTANGDDGMAKAGTPRLEVIEPMGNEIVFYASTSDGTLVARVAPVELPSVGEEVGLYFDTDRVHLFDGATEDAL